MKAYTVVELDWEYNDEYYFRPDGDGYNIKKAYRHKKKAEDEVTKLNISTIRGTNLIDFGGEDWEESITDMPVKDFKKACADLGCKVDGQYTLVVPNDISVKNAEKILALTNLRWYEVVEVEVEG